MVPSRIHSPVRRDRRRAGHPRVLARGRCPAPGERGPVRAPALDQGVRCVLRAPPRRHGPADGRAHDDPRPGRAARRAGGRRGPLGRAREGRADPHPRVAQPVRVPRERRAAVLPVLRGDAHPDVLPHRGLGRRQARQGGGEVPAVLARGRTGHAVQRHRARRLVRQPGRAQLPPRGPGQAQRVADDRDAAVPRVLRRVRGQGAHGARAHLAAGHGRAGRHPVRPRCWSASSTRSAPSG